MQPKMSRRRVSLTSAEAAVLTLLATSGTLSAIGDELSIDRPKVMKCAQRIYEKLGVSTRAEAVKRAEVAGWIPVRENRRLLDRRARRSGGLLPGWIEFSGGQIFPPGRLDDGLSRQ
jgi:DNA-binding CsgD family transcriptional regulator